MHDYLFSADPVRLAFILGAVLCALVVLPEKLDTVIFINRSDTNTSRASASKRVKSRMVMK